MSMPVIDADGHILEQEEQLARYLDWPYREPGRAWTFYPRDGWNRRLGGRLRHGAHAKVRVGLGVAAVGNPGAGALGLVHRAGLPVVGDVVGQAGHDDRCHAVGGHRGGDGRGGIREGNAHGLHLDLEHDLVGGVRVTHPA